MSSATEPRTWPDLAIQLYDRLTDRNAEIAYDFRKLNVSIPGSTEDSSRNATWTLDGTLRITTRNLDTARS